MTDTNIIRVGPLGQLVWRGKTYKCALGKSGITTSKREGDGGTPAGTFPLREVFYRPDRIEQPNTNLPRSRLTPADGWSDDPDHVDYNTKIVLPHSGRSEELWRKDKVYDLIIVIGYNDKPPLKGQGSAIFMHVVKKLGNGDYSPTEGCIALTRNDLLEILEYLTPKSQIEILNN
jgi:L,D-peptidoglycan transpeptidase YkuD (ErfK/YbiS/YcfS/YnhG family)